MYVTVKHNKMKTNVALIVLFIILCVGCGKKNADVGETQSNPEIKEESVQVETEQNEQSQEESANVGETIQGDELEKEGPKEEANNSSSEDTAVRNENLNGRGRSDEGRSEPNYVNVIGYAVVSYDEEYELKKTDDFQNEDYWQIPTYEKDKQFWNETEITLPHKTEVLVKEQYLEHEGWGHYSGYLLVETLEDSANYYINVNNYITKPYWTYDNDLRSAALEGNYIAEYKQVSDYYPVDSGGEKVEIPDGTIVLVNGVAGTTGKFDSDTNSIEAMVWKEWKLGYGGVDVYFNAEDLTIID